MPSYGYKRTGWLEYTRNATSCNYTIYKDLKMPINHHIREKIGQRV